MRLLFLTPSYPPFPGGGERYTRSLAKYLTNRGHFVTVVTSTARTEQDFWESTDRQDSAEEIIDGAIKIIRCRLSSIPGGRPTLFTWRKLMVMISSLPGDSARLLSRMARLFPPIDGLDDIVKQLPEQYDLVHGFNISWEYPLVEAYQMACRRNLPLIVTPFLHAGTGEYDRVTRNSTMDHQRQIMKQADAVLTLTSIEAERLHNWQIRPRIVNVIGGGLDPLPPLRVVAETMDKFGLSGRIVLFVGRASFDKGAIHAAKSVLRLNQEGLSVTLALVGQESPEFSRFFRRLNNHERKLIRRLGLVDEQDKHTLLEGARVLVMPSRSDSFGIVFLEAWAHRKPVIGSWSGGIPAVVEDGKNGLLVAFGDGPALDNALRRLLTDPELSKKMGQRGHDKVFEQYTWEKVTDRVESSYRQVLNPSP